MKVSADCLRRQIESILTAWGMEPGQVKTTTGVMVDTDLAGIDSHGISMLMMYEDLRAQGRLNLHARPFVVRETPVTALIDADAGLGHPAAVMGMNLAMEKALVMGVAAVSVRNSHHFGAAGCYAVLAANRGLIGMVTTSARTVCVVPTRGAVPVLGTNPIAFAAPAKSNRPFLLDMSTSTVAANKVKVYEMNQQPLPEGWVSDEAGSPVSDATIAMDLLYKRHVGGLSPLGGNAGMRSHKGYGLGVMVQILSATLSGGAFGAVHQAQTTNAPDNIGHFFLVIDPKMFRLEGEFEDDLDGLMDFLRQTRPADPAEPVLVAGDTEAVARQERLRTGVQLPASLTNSIEAICKRAGVPFILQQMLAAA